MYNTKRPFIIKPRFRFIPPAAAQFLILFMLTFILILFRSIKIGTAARLMIPALENLEDHSLFYLMKMLP